MAASPAKPNDEPRLVIFRVDEKPSRWVLAGLAMHALIHRATYADEKRTAVSIAAEAVRHADALMEFLGNSRGE